MMNMTESTVKGVFHCERTDTWYARTPGKRNLYKGDSRTKAEYARLAFDAQVSINHQPQKKPRRASDLFKCAIIADWPASGGGFEGFDLK